MNHNAQFVPHVALARFRGIAAFRSRCRRQALAQTANVTLYGIVDVGVQRNHRRQGGDHTSLASGIMEGSRWACVAPRTSATALQGHVRVLENRFQRRTLVA